jgi:hypothetical protein
MTEADLTATMYRELLSALGEECELWYELLWELVGAIYVVAARDDARQLVGCHVRLHHHFCRNESKRTGSQAQAKYQCMVLHSCCKQGVVCMAEADQARSRIQLTCASLGS